MQGKMNIAMIKETVKEMKKQRRKK